MSFKPLGDDLHRRIQQSGISDQVEAALVLEKVIVVFQEIFGKDVEAKMKPLYVKRRVLTVSCSSSVVAQELKLHEREIIKKVNDQFDHPMVDRLRFFA